MSSRIPQGVAGQVDGRWVDEHARLLTARWILAVTPSTRSFVIAQEHPTRGCYDQPGKAHWLIRLSLPICPYGRSHEPDSRTHVLFAPWPDATEPSFSFVAALLMAESLYPLVLRPSHHLAPQGLAAERRQVVGRGGLAGVGEADAGDARALGHPADGLDDGPDLVAGALLDVGVGGQRVEHHGGDAVLLGVRREADAVLRRQDFAVRPSILTPMKWTRSRSAPAARSRG